MGSSIHVCAKLPSFTITGNIQYDESDLVNQATNRLKGYHK